MRYDLSLEHPIRIRNGDTLGYCIALFNSNTQELIYDANGSIFLTISDQKKNIIISKECEIKNGKIFLYLSESETDIVPSGWANLGGVGSILITGEKEIRQLNLSARILCTPLKIIKGK